MGDYTKLDLTQSNEILKNYQLGNVLKVQALSLGISNSNYKIATDKGCFLLKVSNDKNVEELRKEQEILLFLSKNDFTYSLCPLETRTKKLVYEWNEFHGVLFPFIEGIPPGPNDQTCQEIGRALALLHLTNPKDARAALRNHEEVGFGPAQIYSFLENQHCPDDFKKTFQKLFANTDIDFENPEFERGIIHGDLYYDNTLFDQNHLKVLLDFEQAGIGELIFDLGISMGGTCLEKGRISIELIHSYLKGYTSVRSLPEKESRHLYQMVLLGLFSISLWRIKRFKIGDLNPLLANSYQELIIRAEVTWSELQSRNLL